MPPAQHQQEVLQYLDQQSLQEKEIRKQYMQEIQADWDRSIQLKSTKQQLARSDRSSGTTYQPFEGEDPHVRERNRAKAEQVSTVDAKIQLFKTTALHI